MMATKNRIQPTINIGYLSIKLLNALYNILSLFVDKDTASEHIIIAKELKLRISLAGERFGIKL